MAHAKKHLDLRLACPTSSGTLQLDPAAVTEATEKSDVIRLEHDAQVGMGDQAASAILKKGGDSQELSVSL